MPLLYVGSAKATGNAAAFSVSLTALTGGADTAARAGDLVIVASGWVGTADGDPGVSTAGYTEVADLWANDTRDANLSVAWKLMPATPDTSVTVNGSGTATNGSAAIVHVWRNVDQTTPLDVVTTTNTGINAATPDSPSITPVTAGAVVLSVGMGTGAATDTTVTAPTGYTNQVDTTVDPGNAIILGIASKVWSGAGAEDPAAWTNFTTSTSDSWAAATLAIRPASTAQSFSHTGSGGVVSAGAAAVRRTLVAAGVGGILASGAAATAFHPSRIYSAPFTITPSYAVSGTGGLQSGGAATVVRRAVAVGSGGLQAGGSAAASRVTPVLSNPFTITAQYVVAGTGGLTSSGAALSVVRRTSAGSGGLASGGAASVRVRRATVGSGGLAAGGAATVSYTSTAHNTYSATGAGGMTASGGALVARIRSAIGSGGLASAGVASVAQRRAVTPVGGLQASGSAVLQRRFAVTASGGLSSGGAANTEYVPGLRPVLALSPTRVSLAPARTTATITNTSTRATLAPSRTSITIRNARTLAVLSASRTGVTVAPSRTDVTLE